MLTIILIAVTVVVSWLAFERPGVLQRLILWPPAIDRSRQFDRLLTHGFIHADWSHLLFNMITLYFFGRLVERWYVPLIGHVGFGGSVGFADPACGLAFGYALNRHGTRVTIDERAQSLIDATYRCLGYQTDEPGVWIA